MYYVVCSHDALSKFSNFSAEHATHCTSFVHLVFIFQVHPSFVHSCLPPAFVQLFQFFVYISACLLRHCLYSRNAYNYSVDIMHRAFVAFAAQRFRNGQCSGCNVVQQWSSTLTWAGNMSASEWVLLAEPWEAWPTSWVEVYCVIALPYFSWWCFAYCVMYVQHNLTTRFVFRRQKPVRKLIVCNS